MGSSLPSERLTPLQKAVLRAFFARERGFHLTGGAALAGYYLGHRTTDDLDLFALDDPPFERGRHVLSAVAAELGASLAITQDVPGFLRVILKRNDEALVIDLVRERVAQLHPDKPEREGVRIDPPDEILANKLNTLVSRAEERDLIDVLFLERAGYRVESVLDAALAKDGGCTPATLAWVLSELAIPDGIALPGGVTPAELREFTADLIRRFRRAALPEPSRG
jgi:hypothetical protein